MWLKSYPSMAMAHYKEKQTAKATGGNRGEGAGGPARGFHYNWQKYKDLLNLMRRILAFLRVDFKGTVC
jgi:hypothetical protein